VDPADPLSKLEGDRRKEGVDGPVSEDQRGGKGECPVAVSEGGGGGLCGAGACAAEDASRYLAGDPVKDSGDVVQRGGISGARLEGFLGVVLAS
jgi:hypothetical protein